MLNDAGTMEFVSVRALRGHSFLQVAFERRPVGGTTLAYIAFVDPMSLGVEGVARANWYALDPA
jgi:hypothetical protein